MKIGFIGLGNMRATPMARNLAKNGHAVKGYDVVPALLDKAASQGIARATPVADCVAGSEVVITMLPSSPHVRSVYGNESGVLAHAKPGMLLVDSSTIDPLAREVAFDALAKGVAMVDAPSPAGPAGWKPEPSPSWWRRGEGFEAARTILAAMGKNIVHCGGSGNGQVAKICNNLMLAIEMIATSEGMTLAAKLGMDPKAFAGIVNTSSGRCWSSTPTTPIPASSRTRPPRAATPAASARTSC